MNLHKKISIIFSLLLVVGVLFGCGSSNNATTAETSDAINEPVEEVETAEQEEKSETDRNKEKLTYKDDKVEDDKTLSTIKVGEQKPNETDSNQVRTNQKETQQETTKKERETNKKNTKVDNKQTVHKETEKREKSKQETKDTKTNVSKEKNDKQTEKRSEKKTPKIEQSPKKEQVNVEPKPKKEQVNTKPAPTASSSHQLNQFERQVVDLTNEERAKQGLPKLSIDTKLSNVARIKSQDMLNKRYFSHHSPTYGSLFDMMKQFGINFSYASESIAKGHRSPKEVVNGWMNSSGHRQNILSKDATHIGVGHVSEGNYWTQMFIKK